MVNKIKFLLHKYWDIVTYLFFGVLTTAVNFLVYFPCHNWWGISATGSNLIAWFVAVIFAYVTNKPFVFKSHNWSMKVVGPELSKFVFCRVGSGFMETLFLLITVDMMSFNGNWMKVIISVLVVVLNYVASKLLVFRKR